jgi:hypothetical protein
MYKRSQASQLSVDAQVVARLVQAGSDLRKPHSVDFFLYVPSEAGAKRLAQKLARLGFEVRVEPVKTTSLRWMTFANRTMLVEVVELENLRRQFEEMSREEGGVYDGWGSEVVK